MSKQRGAAAERTGDLVGPADPASDVPAVFAACRFPTFVHANARQGAVSELMTEIFDHNSPDRCCLCGAADSLTGEHRLKAAALRSRFKWTEPVVFVRQGEPQAAKPVQGPKSDRLHFDARICLPCNSSRTQASDIAFSSFDQDAQKIAQADDHPGLAAESPNHPQGSAAWLDVMRYFAKCLACAIAEAGGPRFIALTDFAIRRSDEEVVALSVARDALSDRYVHNFGDDQIAYHHGLRVLRAVGTNLVEEIESGFTLGLVRYTYRIVLEPALSEALRYHSPAFAMRSIKFSSEGTA